MIFFVLNAGGVEFLCTETVQGQGKDQGLNFDLEDGAGDEIQGPLCAGHILYQWTASPAQELS